MIIYVDEDGGFTLVMLFLCLERNDTPFGVGKDGAVMLQCRFADTRED